MCIILDLLLNALLSIALFYSENHISRYNYTKLEFKLEFILDSKLYADVQLLYLLLWYASEENSYQP